MHLGRGSGDPDPGRILESGPGHPQAFRYTVKVRRCSVRRIDGLNLPGGAAFMPDILETSRKGRVLRVALNRTEKRNALNAELCRILVETLEGAFADSAVGAILLCG